ncbi:MAG: hypothetical protein AAGM22_07965 [Acidobacteriota bacterium]
MNVQYRPRACLVPLVLSLALAAAATGIASADELGTAPSSPTFDFDRAAEHPLIEFTVRHDELVDEDPTPLLRLYGDGSVHVHVPIYMKGAGTYRMSMSDAALEALLSSLASHGVLDFEHDRVVAAKDVAEQSRHARDGSWIHISDTSWTLIRVRLDRYDPQGTGLDAGPLDRQIRWPDVDWHAEHYPNVAAISGLAEAQRTLVALIDSAKRTPAFEEN